MAWDGAVTGMLPKRLYTELAVGLWQMAFANRLVIFMNPFPSAPNTSNPRPIS